MPFTITTPQAVYNKKTMDRSANDTTKLGNGKASGCRLNIEAKGYYRISRLLRKLGIKLVFGGHKHTFAISKPIYDAPIDENGNRVFPDQTKDINEDPFMSEYLGDSLQTSLSVTNFPIIEVTKDSGIHPTPIGTYHKVDSLKAPIYVMSQATGYKLVSNKELPPPLPSEIYSETSAGEVLIPWLLSYFPASTVKNLTSLTAYTRQYHPMYIKYDLSAGEDTGLISVKAY